MLLQNRLQHPAVIGLFFDGVRKEKVRFSRNQRLAWNLFDVQYNIAMYQIIHHIDPYFAVSLVAKTTRGRRFYRHFNLGIALLQCHTLYRR
jgi:hypothetical protein